MRLFTLIRASFVFLFFFAFAQVSQAQYVPTCDTAFAPFNTSCAQNKTTDIYGRGSDGLNTFGLAIPDGATADRVLVEVIVKNGISTASTTMSIHSATETVIATGTPCPVLPVSGACTNCGVYYAFMTPTDSVWVTTNNPGGAKSLVTYVLRDRSNQCLGGTSILNAVYLYHQTYDTTYTIPPTTTPTKRVKVTIPLADGSFDNRYGIVILESDSVTITDTICTPDLGNSLNILRYELTGIPGSTDSIRIRVISLNPGSIVPNPCSGLMTDPGGDSYVIGAVSVNADCGFVCPPASIDDTLTTCLNTPTDTASLITNDFHPNGAPFSFTGITASPINGSVEVIDTATAAIIYTPNPGYLGTDTFIYQLCTYDTLCNFALVYVNVNGLPRPIAIADSFNLFAGGADTIDVTANDISAGGVGLVVSSVFGGPSNGTATILADNTIEYVANPGFSGADTFYYTVCLDTSICTNSCDTGVAYVNVMSTNLPPVGIKDINGTFKDIPVDGFVLTNDYDLNGDSIYVSALYGSPSNGGVILNADGSYTYTPNAGFTGDDYFSYIVCDVNPLGSLCDTALVQIAVVDTPLYNNNPPVAMNDAAVTYVDLPVSGNLVANDDDPEGDSIAVNTTPTLMPASGAVVINTDGTFDYTPNPGFVGEDTFQYQVCEVTTAELYCDTAWVFITVLDTPTTGCPNCPPFADDDFAFTEYGTPVSGNVLPNDGDPDGDSLVVSSSSPLTGPSNGSVVINPDGSYTYTPDPGFFGNDQFTYEACEVGTAEMYCATATVYILVKPELVNNPPVAIKDINGTFKDIPVSGSVITNDFDPDMDSIYVSGVVMSPANGSVVLNPDGSYTYTPNAGFTGDDYFIYSLCDVNPIGSLCDTTLVQIAVVDTPLYNNNPPVAMNDAAVTYVDLPVSGNLIANDDDPEGDSIAVNIAPIALPSSGLVTINPDGTFDYIPAPGYVGEDTFQYQVCEVTTAELYCDTAWVFITVLDTPTTGCPNCPPFADDDFAFTEYGTPVSGNVLPNDGDPDGDSLVVSSSSPLTGPSNGTVVINPDGSYTYTPDPGFFGNDQFTYEACEVGTAEMYCATATVYILVKPLLENMPPVAIKDNNATFVNTPVDGNVLTNDFDLNGDSIYVSATVMMPSNGTVVLNADGSYTYTPNADFVGQDEFIYAICDVNPVSTLCDTALVQIEVVDTPVVDNNPPVAMNDAAVTYVNIPVSGNLIVNDQDPDGDTIAVNITPTILPSYGGVTINADGTFDYIPAPGYVGEDTFQYQVCEVTTAELYCDTAWVFITVIDTPTGGCPNCPPFADNDFAITDYNTAVSGNVLPNDFDPDGDSLAVSAASPLVGPFNGSVVQNADGSFTYTPNPGFTGWDAYVYEACEVGTAEMYCAAATVYILVKPEAKNLPPVAIKDINATFKDTPVDGNVLTNDFDLNGDSIYVSSVPVGPANGGLVINPDGSYTYTPNPGFVGDDQFIYSICDVNPLGSLCDTALVQISVVDTPLVDNNPPLAHNDAAVTYINTPVSGNMIANDDDPDGDSIAVNTTPTMMPSSGSVTINPDGTFDYTPSPGFVGEDTFQYQVCEVTTAELFCDTAWVFITVLDTPSTGCPNCPPFADDDFVFTPYNTPVDGNVLPNDNDPDGDSLSVSTASPLTGPFNGSVSQNADGSFTYTPNMGYTGWDYYTYEACEVGTPDTFCATATVHILILPNVCPEAMDDTVYTCEDSITIHNVVANDFDADGNLDPSSVTIITTPVNGIAVSNGDGTITYTPGMDFFGTDSLMYSVADSAGCTDMAWVYYFIDPVNDCPVAINDTVPSCEDSIIVIDVVSNDLDIDLNINPTSVSILSGPANGTATVDSAGLITYTPAMDFVGTDSIKYSVCDLGIASTCDFGTICCDSAWLYIIVDEVNDCPIAINDTVPSCEDSTIVVDVLANDTDIEGNIDASSVSIMSGPFNGSATVDSMGMITYTPAMDFFGADSIMYQVCDSGIVSSCDTAGTPCCATAWLYLNLDPVNDCPIAVDDSIPACEDSTLTINVFANDIDIDGNLDPSSVTITILPSSGVATVDAAGIITYVPSLGFAGADSFQYAICDSGIVSSCDTGAICCDTAWAYISVLFSNSCPTVVDDSIAACEDTPITFNPTTNDVDPDLNLDPSSVSVHSGPFNGTVSIDSVGNITYTPAMNFFGADSFYYSVCDSGALTICDTASTVCCDSGWVYLSVEAVNDCPIAVNDMETTPEITAVDVDVLANDFDIDGNIDTSSVSVMMPPANGSITMIAGGIVTYLPDTGFFGIDSFSYTVCDSGIVSACDAGTPCCDTAWVYITVTEDPDLCLLNIASVVEFASTCGDPNGSATVTLVNGVAPYNYNLNSGTVTGVSPTPVFTITGLNAGTYSLVIYDADSCMTMDVITIENIGAPMVSDTLLAADTCFTSTGVIELTITGSGPFNVNWTGAGSGSATSVSSPYLMTGLSAGTYNIVVSDTNGCSTNLSSVVDPAADFLATISDVTPATCDSSNGSFVVTFIGGTAPYTIVYGGDSLVTANSSDTITGLSAGVYSIEVYDASGCGAELQPVIINSLGGPTTSIDSVVNVLCNGGNGGEVFINILGGVGPYTITYGATIVNVPSPGITDISGLTAGTYNFVIADSLGCITTESVTITQPTAIFVDVFVDSTTSCLATDGQICMNISGGVGPYTITASSGTVPATSVVANGCVTDLGVGTYTVTVTDANGCNTSYMATVYGPPCDSCELNIASIVEFAASCGDSNGVAIITLQNGNPPYSYSLNGGAISGTSTSNIITVNNLPAGLYTLAVADADSCFVGDVITIENYGGPQISAVATAADTCGGLTGAFTISMSGFGPYDIVYAGPMTGSFSGVSSPFNISGLMAGTYNVVVTDSNGCAANTTVTIESVATFTIASINVDPDDCGMSGDGSIVIDIVGGTTPYTVDYGMGTVIAGGSPAVISGLVTGVYNITITDAAGCSDQVRVVVPASDVNSDTLNVMNVTCNGGANGSFDISVPPGVGPVDIFGSNGLNYFGVDSGIYSYTGLTPGNYVVSVVDGDSCINVHTITITQPTQIVVDVEYDTAAICALSNSAVCLTLSGGTAPYTITSTSGTVPGSPVDSAACITGMDNGAGVITVVDANGCPVDINVFLDCNNPPEIRDSLDIPTDSIYYTTTINTPIDTCLNLFDPDGDNIMIQTPFLVIASHGTVINVGDTCFTYVPDSGYVGTDTLQVVVCDDGTPVVLCDTSWIFITVTDDEPMDTIIAVDDYVNTQQDVPVTINVLDNDTLPSGPFTVSISIDPTNGTVVNNGDGTITYIPNAGYTGADSFQYVVCVDVASGTICDTAWVYIQVQPCEIPDGFSPNGDGMNDSWIVDCVENDPATVGIYNRYGDQVWGSDGTYDNTDGWSGTNFSGNNLPDGTYFYVITFEDESIEPISGYVVINR